VPGNSMMSYLEPCISDVIVSFLAMYMHYVVIQVTFGKIWLYFSFWLRHRDDRAVVPGGAHRCAWECASAACCCGNFPIHSFHSCSVQYVL
jgi:hypothetical protein